MTGFADSFNARLENVDGCSAILRRVDKTIGDL